MMDRVTTKKGVWITSAEWLIAVVLLAFLLRGKNYEGEPSGLFRGEAEWSLPRRNWTSTFIRMKNTRHFCLSVKTRGIESRSAFGVVEEN